jgi:hypothetical protein
VSSCTGDCRLDSSCFLSSEFSFQHLDSVSNFQGALSSALDEMLTSTVVGAIILDLDALCGAFESITPCTEEPRTNGEASARLRLIYEQRFHVLCSSIQNLRRRVGGKTTTGPALYRRSHEDP